MTETNGDGHKIAKQCETCPWKVGADVNKIPNYVPALHEGLRDTIAKSPMESMAPVLNGQCVRMMACHYSKSGDEKPCAGWLYNQIGSGNNIGLRLLVHSGRIPIPLVDGDQHDDFESTLPTSSKPRRRRARKARR